MLRWKPAPVQATYLGYVGPVPIPELDWMICDDVTVPPEAAAAYAPRPLPLAGCYQANDGAPTDLPAVSRREEGLPEDAFVFCSFSNHYKITPEVFDAWLTILERAENAVLWLVQAGPVSQRNLTARWIARGLAPERLIFAERVDPARYRARMALADLFLDTTPYNAGTVASDALRMGLPILTVAGRAFAARMATSLLTAVGMPDCIAADMDDYVARAVAFAQDRERHAALKRRLAGDVWTRTLGDAAGFARRLEDAYRRIAPKPARPAGGPAEEGKDRTPPDTLAVDKPVSDAATRVAATRALLHVGCGLASPGKVPAALFAPGEWNEVRLDIDPGVAPDIVASLTDMSVVPDRSFDAVWSAHNLEHVAAHEVPVALAEFLRVLRPGGFAMLTMPDLQQVAALVAEGRLEDTAYLSGMGPIAALDMLYGFRPSIAAGNRFMAHRTGFTAGTLERHLLNAGFATVRVVRDGHYGLWANAARAV